MSVGVFFSFPIKNVENTVMPVIDRLSQTGSEIYYYNTTDFKPSGDCNFRFVAYPNSFIGYGERLNANTSYFEFGDILIDAAKNIIEQLISEVERIKPQFIIYSHLAVWGKLVARYFNLPAIALNTTFILDKRIMLPHFRSFSKNSSTISTVSEAVAFARKTESLYKILGINDVIDPWDVWVNKGDLNIAFIFPEFQPQLRFFGREYQFIGYPFVSLERATEKDSIYFSMGTVFNENMHIFKKCLDTLKQLDIPTIVSAGSKVNIDHLDREYKSSYMEIASFVNQKRALARSKLFINHGGMAGVHEAIYSHTPMIIIPLTPEQQITAQRIDELGIGKHVPLQDIAKEDFKSAIIDILSNSEQYTKRLIAMSNKIPIGSPNYTATCLIHEFLKSPK